MKVGLLGGSFDPVHIGHIKLAAAARRQLKLKTVYLVLTPKSPFKQRNKISPIATRMRWLSSALRGHPGLKVGTWELKRQGPVYTAQTLLDYQRRHPKDEIFFIMGSDAWKSFSRWRAPDVISEMATLVVGKRPGALRFSIPKKYKAAVRVLKGTFPAISSTQIRKYGHHSKLSA